MPNCTYTIVNKPARHTNTQRILRRRLTTIILMLLVVTCGITATVLACGWSGTTRSVRFNWTTTEREMSRLPPLSVHTESDVANATNDAVQDEYDYVTADAKRKLATTRLLAVWQQSQLAGERGDLTEARNLLREFLQLRESSDIDGDLAFDDLRTRPDTNSAHDQLDALDNNASPNAVQAYLAARRAYDAKLVADIADSSWEDFLRGSDIMQSLELAAADHRLKDNCDYLRAAIRYRMAEYADAAGAFDKLADAYPKSEKRDAARYMAGVAWMRASSSYNGESADATEACPTCQDEAWTRAHAAFTRITREHARSRFSADARGWLGYLYLRTGRTAEGLAEYYRLLTTEKNDDARFNAITSLSMTSADPVVMGHVERIIAAEPDVALTYLYHTLYNYSFDHNFAPPDENNFSSGTSSTWGDYYDAQRDNAYQTNGQQAELRRLGTYASDLMRRYPRTKLEGNFALRLAEVNLELDEYAPALDFADRALRLNVTGDFRAESLWIKGVAESRLAKYDYARRTLQQLVSEFPQHRLTEGARRHLAMAAEDAGNMDAALEQYFALNYTVDIAYFVDVLMTPEQLRSFIESHPRHERIDELWYALGIRHIRANRWAEARDAYAHIRTSKETNYWDTAYLGTYGDDEEIKIGGKDPGYNDRVRGVRAAWVAHDLRTIDALERLNTATSVAGGDEARAEAFYQLASYLYEADPLTFYNPAAWQGQRYHTFVDALRPSSYRAPGEVRMLSNYLGEHSTRARALNIYLQIARHYPHTRAAPDALYTAAVCNDRDIAWSDVDNSVPTDSAREVTYADVRRAYPHYQLPRGTFGWEPATRTVNGANGWSPKPKPAPRLSKFERGRRKAWAIYEQVTTPVADVWSDTLRPPLVTFNSWVVVGLRWLLAACAFACMLTMWRAASWSRRVWRERVRWRTSGDAGALAVRVAHGRKAHAKFLRRSRRALDWDYREVRDAMRLKAIASYRFGVRRGRRALPTLAMHSRRHLADPHERQLLALNALTHGAFVVLLVTLLRLLR